LLVDVDVDGCGVAELRVVCHLASTDSSMQQGIPQRQTYELQLQGIKDGRKAHTGMPSAPIRGAAALACIEAALVSMAS
jgi:hypothetical protein